MNSKFKEFWNEFTRDVDLDYVDPEEVAEEAWNAATKKVFSEISHKTTIYDSFGPTPDRLDSIEKELKI